LDANQDRKVKIHQKSNNQSYEQGMKPRLLLQKKNEKKQDEARRLKGVEKEGRRRFEMVELVWRHIRRWCGVV
jgi:hypothetical protein